MTNVVSLAERFPERFPQAVQKPVEKTAAPTTSPTLAERLGVKVGDFFYSSWGYDQTNVDWYKVIEVTKSGKSVKVQEWNGKVVATNIHDAVVPGDGPKTGAWVKTEAGREYDRNVEAPVEIKRLRDITGRASFTLTSYSSGYHWDGTPKYQTGHGLGH